MPDSIFTRIINGEIPSEFLYEDEHCVAIRDINPQAPVHALVIPRKPIPKLSDAAPEDQALLGHLLLAAGRVAARLGVSEAFNLVVNNGEAAGMTVHHLHLHILAGRKLGERRMAENLK